MNYSENEQVKRRRELEVYIWNEAIEAAANICKEMGTLITVEEQIRKLKKDVTY